MADDFDPFGDITPQEQTAAQIAALRRQGSLGVLGQLTGDKVLAPLGQNLVSYAQHGQQMAQQAEGQRLAKAVEAQRAQQENAYRQGELARQAARDEQQKQFQTQELGLRKAALDQDRYGLFNGRDGETFLYSKRNAEVRPIAQATPQQMMGSRGSAKSIPTSYFGEDIEPIHPEAPPRLADKELQEIRASVAANQEFAAKLADYEKLISETGAGGRIIGPAAQRLTTLQGELKPLWLEAKGLKRFTENENHLLDQILPKTSGTGAIVLPATAAAAVQQMRKDAQDSIGARLHARGLQIKSAAHPVGGANGPTATHYLISPDGKMRVPADEKGNPLGPPEPNNG